MNVKHVFKKEVENSSDNPSFILANKSGGFSFFGGEKNTSKYNGVFYFDNWNFFKVIEDIRLKTAEPDTLVNHGYCIERVSNKTVERFTTNHINSLIYDIENYSGFVDLVLDCREIYDFHKEGRVYNIEKKDDLIIVEYIKYKDSSLTEENYRIYLVISGVKEYLLTDKWEPRYYEFDHQRGNHPIDMFVYNALQIKIDNSAELIFSYADSRDEAIEKTRYAMDNREHLKRSKKQYIESMCESLDIPANRLAAYNSSVAALDSLTVDIDGPALYAGFPWFTQVWTRDEAISIGALIKLNKFDEVKTILMRHISSILDDGRVPNRYPASMLGSADGIGWVCARIHDLIRELQKTGQLDKYLNNKELKKLQQNLGRSAHRLIKHHNKSGLARNEALETWMDTGYKDDLRAGARIEIQAMRLRLYRLISHISGLLGDDLKKHAYHELEHTLREHVKKSFWKQPVLKDGADDPTIRPNIFIAYYVYPYLLSKRQWQIAFKHALDNLWLEWGGLTTIAKDHKYFIDTYTGQDNRSYHRGDSWYFINNMAAVCMIRLNRNMFIKYIDKIMDASVKDILSLGVIGFSSELTSANKQSAQGSIAQTWSSAMFIELIKEYY